MEAITRLRKLPPMVLALFASALVPPTLAIAVGAASSDFHLWRLLEPALIVGGVLAFIAWQVARTQEHRRSRQRFPGAPDGAPGTPPPSSRGPQTRVSASAARGHAQRRITGSWDTNGLAFSLLVGTFGFILVVGGCWLWIREGWQGVQPLVGWSHMIGVGVPDSFGLGLFALISAGYILRSSRPSSSPKASAA